MKSYNIVVVAVAIFEKPVLSERLVEERRRHLLHHRRGWRRLVGGLGRAVLERLVAVHLEDFVVLGGRRGGYLRLLEESSKFKVELFWSMAAAQFVQEWNRGKPFHLILMFGARPGAYLRV